jgi:hypothetical protein
VALLSLSLDNPVHRRSNAILRMAFGPPSAEADEEVLVRLEAAGVDIDELRKELAETLAELRSKN